MKLMPALMRLLPGFILIAIIIWKLKPIGSQAGFDFILVVILGFILALYALIGDKKIWGASNKTAGFVPILRLFFACAGILVVVYYSIALFILVLTSV